MRNLSLAAVSLTLFAVSARAEDVIPPKTLATIKAATVFIKVEAGGMSGSGSGFVIKTDGDTAYVVTNHHVVVPHALELILVPGPRRPSYPYGRRGRPYSPAPEPSSPTYTPRIIERTFKNAAVTVVFSSGTSREESVRGEVLAADPEQDLAVIKVSGVKELPKPIDYLHEPKVAETTPIYTFGFPFGKLLSTSKGGPAITVGKGSISSLRMDDNGDLALVQIDGALNPGNSGGPVVESRGRLVGVAVATIRDSSGIGLAIPCRELVRTLQGRVGKLYLHANQDADGLVTVHVEAGLIDPLNKIKSVTLHYLSSKSLQDKPKPSDPLSPLPGCRKLPLKIENQVATGEFTLKRGITEVSILHQAVYVNETGKPGLTKNVAETIRVGPAAVAGAPGGSRGGRGTETRILGGGGDPQFRDAAPPKSLLVGFEVGLGKQADSDVVCALRPIYANPQGEEILGQQHGTDTSRLERVKAKDGYAVAGVTARAAATVAGFSLTFMKVDKDRLDPKDSYESEWIGGKNGSPETRLGGDGASVIGIVGRANGRDCTGLGLLLQSAPATPSPPVVATPWGRHGPRPVQVAPTPGDKGVSESHGEIHYQRGIPPAAPGVAALDADRVTRSLPEAADDVAAGGNGRYLFFHLPKLRKLAVFDVAQAKIVHYIPLDSDSVLFAAGGEKLIVVLRDMGIVQRYDLATQKKELSVTLPEAGQAESMALGCASAGPAVLMTSMTPKFLDLVKLSVVEMKNNRGGAFWDRHVQVRASADGSAFAGWGNSGSPSGLFFWTLDGDIMQSRYEHVSAGCASPSYDGRLVFTGAGGIYSADLRPQPPPQARDATYFPAYHPAYFLGFSGVDRVRHPGRAENLKPKLSLYTTADKRQLVSFNDFDEIGDIQEAPYGRYGALSIDKRIHYFPTANLLLILTETRDQLVLRKLDVTAALDKAGIDYLYVASLPPATAAPGSALSYTLEVKSKRGGVHCTLDSGPEGMTVSDDGKLLWSVPAGEKAGRQGVIITIKDASGQEILHSFNIAIR